MIDTCVGEAAAAHAAPGAGGRALSVKRGFGWCLSGYVIYMLCQWAILVALTRWGSPDLSDVALFAMALAITTPIVLFSNLGLRRVYATDAKASFRFPDYFKLRMVTNVAALAMIAGVVCTRGFRAEIVWATLVMGAARMIESTSDILHGYFQERGRIEIGARGTMMKGILSLAGFLAAFFATGNVLLSIAGMGAGWAAVLVFYEWPWALRFRRGSSAEASPVPPNNRDPSRSWMHLANLALPLGIVALVTSLKGSIPVFVIESHLGVTALGLFVALIYFLNGSNRVVSALGEAAAARLAALYKAGNDREVVRLIARMLAAALAVSGLGLGIAVAAGDPLLEFFYGPRCAGLGWLLVAIMAAACVANLQTVLDYAMMSIRHFRIQPYLYGVGALLLLILCAVLVPAKGLSGAALALGIVSGVELLAAGVVVARAVTRLRTPAALSGLETR